jgi:hypothetical protein
LPGRSRMMWAKADLPTENDNAPGLIDLML